MAKMTPEERREQCRQAGLAAAAKLTPDERRAKAKLAAAASVRARFGDGLDEDKDLAELDTLEIGFNAIERRNNDRHGLDPQKAFRTAGLTEAAVARWVKRLAEKSRSDTVRIRAYELAAKILKMVREDSQQAQGVAILIEAAEPQTQVNIVAPRPASEPMGNHPKPSRPGGPVHIVK